MNDRRKFLGQTVLVGASALTGCADFSKIEDPAKISTSASSSTSSNAEVPWVGVAEFGAIGNGSSDDTAAIQRALDSGAKHLFLTHGKTYCVTALTMSGDDLTLHIPSGSTLRGTVATKRIITVSGARCSITGSGKVSGPATFDGANVRPDYAMIWVTGDDFRCEGITLDTIPKEGLMFEDSTGHRVVGVRFVGRYPYSSYDPSSTTNHCAIMYNPPPSANAPDYALVVDGCIFESCIQGILVGNYDAAASTVGINIVGNTFRQCWDHGIYMTLGEGHNITGNTFISCKVPIVTDGVGATICGNTLYSTELEQSNGNQIISVREARNSVISGNTLYGIGASITIDCYSGTEISNNVIANNVIVSTGPGITKSAIRLGFGAHTCADNLIVGNRISGGSYGTYEGAIQLEMGAGYFGERNIIADNSITRSNVGPLISCDRHTFVQIRHNHLIHTASADSAATVSMIWLGSSSIAVIESNTFFYRSGGANVSVRGVQVESSCALPVIRNNQFQLTSASLAAVVHLSLNTASDVSRNQLDPNAAMGGSFTWPSGGTSCTVSNLNVNSNSRILVSPKDPGAGAVLRDKGYYIVPSTQSFTIYTASGDATAGTSEWAYVIE